MKNNKGFSLVELIIVIAIMAILVGVLAPTYIRYVQKAAIASDLQLAKSVSESLTYASVNNDVLDDSASKAILDGLTSPTKLEDLDSPSNNALAKEIMDTLGWSSLSQADYVRLLKSRHGNGATIYVQYQGTNVTPFIVWISNTDSRGNGNLSNNASTIANIGDCICAR